MPSRTIIAIILLSCIAPAANAQRVADATLSLNAPFTSAQSGSSILQSASAAPVIREPRPRWMKAAVIGAIGGGVAFAGLHWMFQDWNPQNSMGKDILIGAVSVGTIAGASVAFYDWVCAPGSASDQAGLCSGLPVRNVRFHDSPRGRPMPR
jgi:hypothetical protein